MGKSIDYKQRLEQLVVRRELSKAKRLESRKKRLHVNISGFKSYYEEM